MLQGLCLERASSTLISLCSPTSMASSFPNASDFVISGGNFHNAARDVIITTGTTSLGA
jgi:hypothetical protein